MAEAQAAGGVRGGAQGGGFTVNEPDEDARQGGADSGETGRTIGFTVTEQDSQASATVGVEQPLPKRRRCSVCGEAGHTARSCPNVGSVDQATKAPTRPTKEAVGMLAPAILQTVNLGVVTAFGPACGMSEFEAKLAVPSLQRTLERMPPAVAKRAAWIIDPAVLFTVTIMWMKRIGDVKKREAEQEYVVAPQEAARAAGMSGSNYTASTANGNVPHAAEQPETQPIRPDSTTGAAVPPEIREGFDGNF